MMWYIHSAVKLHKIWLFYERRERRESIKLKKYWARYRYFSVKTLCQSETNLRNIRISNRRINYIDASETRYIIWILKADYWLLFKKKNIYIYIIVLRYNIWSARIINSLLYISLSLVLLYNIFSTKFEQRVDNPINIYKVSSKWKFLF